MPQVLTRPKEGGRKISRDTRSALILVLGFVGGTLGAVLHMALLWVLPMLHVKLPYEDLLVPLSLLVWWVSSIFTMGWAMKWFKRFE